MQNAFEKLQLADRKTEWLINTDKNKSSAEQTFFCAANHGQISFIQEKMQGVFLALKIMKMLY